MLEVIGFIMGAICFPITIIAFYFQIRDLKKTTKTFAQTFARAYYENFLKSLVSLIETQSQLKLEIDGSEHEIPRENIFLEIRVPLIVKSINVRTKNAHSKIVTITNGYRNLLLKGDFKKIDNSINLFDIPTIFVLLAISYADEDRKKNSSHSIYREAKVFKNTLEGLFKISHSSYASSNIKVVLSEE